jgi:hypothetical protein
MAHRTVPDLVKQRSMSPDALPTPLRASPRPAKKQESPDFRAFSRQEHPEAFLPAERRRPLSSRLDDILADPRSARCPQECHLCSDVAADAALAQWDALARSGVWPIRAGHIRVLLRESGTFIGCKPLRRLLAHRRRSVLSKLVREEIEACHRHHEENAAAAPCPQ